MPECDAAQADASIVLHFELQFDALGNEVFEGITRQSRELWLGGNVKTFNLVICAALRRVCRVDFENGGFFFELILWTKPQRANRQWRRRHHCHVQ